MKLQFGSRRKNGAIVIVPKTHKMNEALGIRQGVTKGIRIDYTNHFADLEAQKKAKRWTDEQYEAIIDHLFGNESKDIPPHKDYKRANGEGFFKYEHVDPKAFAPRETCKHYWLDPESQKVVACENEAEPDKLFCKDHVFVGESLVEEVAGS